MVTQIQAQYPQVTEFEAGRWPAGEKRPSRPTPVTLSGKWAFSEAILGHICVAVSYFEKSIAKRNDFITTDLDQ